MEKERKLQIIRAALKRFTKHGIKKTIFDEIARDLRMGKATLYHYFRSKEELYYQTLRFDIEQYFSELKNIFLNPEKSLSEKLDEYFSIKEGLSLKYKLIHELILHILNNTEYLGEKQIYSEMVLREQDNLKELMKQLLKGKDSSPEWFPEYLIALGWSFIFINNLKIDDNPGGILRNQIINSILGSN